MSPPRTVHLSLPSRLDHLNLVQEVAEEIAQIAGLDEDGRLDFGLAVREGVVNAMKHAHGFDETKPVELTFVVEDDGTHLSATIVDHGPGFDPERTPDPTAPENLLKTSGRGLLLMRSLVDEVRYERRRTGMSLRLVKRLPAGAAARRAR